MIKRIILTGALTALLALGTGAAAFAGPPTGTPGNGGGGGGDLPTCFERPGGPSCDY